MRRLALILALLAVTPALAQVYRAPRTADGRPDLQGTWTNETLTRLERAPEMGGRLVMTEDEVKAVERPDVWRKVMRVGGQPRTSLLTTPDGRVPPMRAGAGPDPRYFTLKPGEAVTDNSETQLIDDRCILPIGNNAGPVLLPLPNNSNYQIVQDREHIALVSEMIHDVRVIRMTGARRTDGVRPYLGDSIGRWEGETLVVETTNFPILQAFRGSWINLKVTERFTRTAPDRLRYQFTVDDPSKWERAWGGEYEFAALDRPLEEYACREGEVSVFHMLDAARHAEREARD